MNIKNAVMTLDAVAFFAISWIAELVIIRHSQLLVTQDLISQVLWVIQHLMIIIICSASGVVAMHRCLSCRGSLRHYLIFYTPIIGIFAQLISIIVAVW